LGKPHFHLKKRTRGFRQRQNPLENQANPVGLLHAVSSPEPLDTTGGVNQFLFAGEKGMACGAYLRGDLLFGGTAAECVAAQTFDRDIIVLGMNSFSHIFLLVRIVPDFKSGRS
jgi:hypothetical protein